MSRKSVEISVAVVLCAAYIIFWTYLYWPSLTRSGCGAVHHDHPTDVTQLDDCTCHANLGEFMCATFHIDGEDLSVSSCGTTFAWMTHSDTVHFTRVNPPVECATEITYEVCWKDLFPGFTPKRVVLSTTGTYSETIYHIETN